MVRFNKGKNTVARPASAVSTVSGGVRTHQGGAGWARDTKSELVMLAVTYLPAEGTHYELGPARDSRFVPLIRAVAIEDPEWGVRFLDYLRSETGMRSGAIIGAAEFARARTERNARGWTRWAVDVVCQRADEPGEFIAYWMANVGRALPKPVKRGLALAVWRLYSEWSAIKWDSARNPWRFADVIGLVRPTGILGDSQGTHPIKGTWRADLYEYLRLDRMFDHHPQIPERLRMLRAYRDLMDTPVGVRREWLRPDVLKAAGMTREIVAGWLEGPMDAVAYEAVIPSMGFTALVRNLRNFDQAGVSDRVAQQVIDVLTDPDNVRKSRIQPLVLLSAYREMVHLRWAWALEQAMTHALGNVPLLRGSSLILVDTSTSMNHPLSSRSVVRRWDAAVTFGIAQAQRCERVDLVSFSSTARYWGDPHEARTRVFGVRPGEAVLTAVQRWRDEGCFLGGGTATAAAVRRHFTPTHDRVIILTDEQTGCDPTDLDHSMPTTTPMYVINLAGEQFASVPSGPNRHAWGGLNDEMFRVITLVEAGKSADWDAILPPARRGHPAPGGARNAKVGVA